MEGSLCRPGLKGAMVVISSAREGMPVDVQARLIASARDHAPREVVGYVVASWDLVFVPNVAEDPDLFEVSDEVQVQVYTEYGTRLAGIFHSHPAGRRTPSNSDIEYAPYGLRYWIITPTEVIEWDMDYDPPIERTWNRPDSTGLVASAAPDRRED